MSFWWILSLDGGGIRGILTSRLLERIEEQCPGWLNRVNLFAGTSTGGILALGLAAGLPPQRMTELYEQCGRTVFADSLWDNVCDLGNLIGANYDNKPLKQILQDCFGSRTLADLPYRVLVSAFDLDHIPADPTVPRCWKAKFFHNFPGEGSDGEQRVVDVALRTSAAPTFFPIYQGYADGGLIANNPGMCALAQALHPLTGKQRLEDLVLLSLGTGLSPKFIIETDADWGLAQWTPFLIDLMMSGHVSLADYQCRQILGERYMRLNPTLPQPIGLDCAAQIPLLKEVADRTDLQGVIEWLHRYYAPSNADPA